MQRHQQRSHSPGEGDRPMLLLSTQLASSWLFLGVPQIWWPMPDKPPRAADSGEELAAEATLLWQFVSGKHNEKLFLLFCHLFIGGLIWHI